ncbi:hypothetical protein PTKU64_80470 [Paraburkholderia terrae]|uniref:Uncharacterized protein n=1 Tax=Paraburkholderia terrae TaxID=311230 RepID=A0ABM7U9E9_9BURK|nr:hypothetical protein [Paraburkholderia terrae]BCZ84372.1 hypothetical protein PTKU64_80470 [Paraburkholderia terrae]
MHSITACRVSDALFRLGRKGYLEVSFGRGWKVCDIDFEQLDQFYELRTVVEVASIDTLSMTAPPDAAIDELKSVWCVPVELRESYPSVMFAMDENFHRGLVADTSNAQMLHVHDEVAESCDAWIFSSCTGPARPTPYLISNYTERHEDRSTTMCLVLSVHNPYNTMLISTTKRAR